MGPFDIEPARQTELACLNYQQYFHVHNRRFLAMAIREVLVRVTLVIASCAGTLLLVEGALRASAWWTEAGGGSVEQRLAKSGHTAPAQADQATFSLRGLVQASSHPDVVYELKPGLRGLFRGQRVEISSQGLRDRDYARAKPEGTFRIVGLGDSVMFGWGVDQDDSYLEVLERRFEENPLEARRVEVLNFAVPGYNTAMEVATLEHRALAFDPDLVVVHFIINDLRLPHFMQMPRDRLSWRHSFLFDLIRSRLKPTAAASGGLGGGLLDHGLDEIEKSQKQQVRQRYRHLAGEEGLRRACARLDELTRARSIPVVVLTFGDRHEHFELLDEVVKKHGFQSLTASRYFAPYFRQQGAASSEVWADTFWISRRDHHPNVLGHALYAEALWDYLISDGNPLLISY